MHTEIIKLTRKIKSHLNYCQEIIPRLRFEPGNSGTKAVDIMHVSRLQMLVLMYRTSNFRLSISSFCCFMTILLVIEKNIL